MFCYAHREPERGVGTGERQEIPPKNTGSMCEETSGRGVREGGMEKLCLP